MAAGCQHMRGTIRDRAVKVVAITALIQHQPDWILCYLLEQCLAFTLFPFFMNHARRAFWYRGKLENNKPFA